MLLLMLSVLGLPKHWTVMLNDNYESGPDRPSSNKTRIKTQYNKFFKAEPRKLTDHLPTKQGLRHACDATTGSISPPTDRPSSNKTRIKTPL